MSFAVVIDGPFLDLVDHLYAARMEGRDAGRSGHLKGENPYACECHRAQWDHGWDNGARVFQSQVHTVVIRG